MYLVLFMCHKYFIYVLYNNNNNLHFPSTLHVCRCLIYCGTLIWYVCFIELNKRKIFLNIYQISISFIIVKPTYCFLLLYRIRGFGYKTYPYPYPYRLYITIYINTSVSYFIFVNIYGVWLFLYPFIDRFHFDSRLGMYVMFYP